MSIAWGSLVLLLLLLPGVLFFVGLYIPEQFTRETTERSPLGQLAAILLVSFTVHGGLFLFQPALCGGGFPCIDLRVVIETLSAERPDGSAARRLAANLASHWGWIFSYVLGTATLGVIAGWCTGRLVVKGRLRGLTQHTWVYDLSVGDNFTIAYVMTHVKHDNRVLMYQGFLKGFGLQRDGRFSYIVLTDVVRGYMHLGEDCPVTSETTSWRKIGQTPTSVGPLSSTRTNARRERSYFVIEGEDIGNVVFDRLVFDFNVKLEDLANLIDEVRRQLAAEMKPSREMPTKKPARRKKP